MNTKIFLDSGDPKQTTEVLQWIDFLTGQTTNPSLVASNPEVKAKIEKGEKFTREEINELYKKIVQDISVQIPEGSVSIEVYADFNTSVEEILSQAREMNSWIPNAHIKLPLTKNALAAAEILIKEGVRLNITLVFSQEQAAAVYAATRGAKKGDVFLSPFIGRLDDRGENGVDFIKNVLQMYKPGDSHVEVLAASVRTLDHLWACLQMNCDIVTVPFKILKEWKDNNLSLPKDEFEYHIDKIPIPFTEVSLEKNWQEYNINHELTTKGIEKFCADWNNLIK